MGADALLAATNEGGLFEYGTDQEIVDNLRALRDVQLAPLAQPRDDVVAAPI